MDGGGYDRGAAAAARESAVVITPPSLVAVLAAGWEPCIRRRLP